MTQTDPPTHCDADGSPRVFPGLINNGVVTFRIGQSELIDDLESLWLSLFDHHATVGAGGLPLIDRSQSWQRRRALYEDAMSKPDTFIVLARIGDTPIGYTLAHVHSGADDTWPTGTRIGEIETLAVAPEHRGRGLGTALLDHAEGRLAGLGAHDVKLSVVNGNASAMRFYERRGMTAVMTTYLRIGSAPPDTSEPPAHPLSTMASTDSSE